MSVVVVGCQGTSGPGCTVPCTNTNNPESDWKEQINTTTNVRKKNKETAMRQNTTSWNNTSVYHSTKEINTLLEYEYSHTLASIWSNEESLRLASLRIAPPPPPPPPRTKKGKGRKHSTTTPTKTLPVPSTQRRTNHRSPKRVQRTHTTMAIKQSHYRTSVAPSSIDPARQRVHYNMYVLVNLHQQ